MFGFEIGQSVRSLLKYTDATKGIVIGFDRENRRVIIGWDDGVDSAERPEYIEVIK